MSSKRTSKILTWWSYIPNYKCDPIIIILAVLRGLGWTHILTVVSSVQTCYIKPISFSKRRLVSSDRQNRGIWFSWRSEAELETCSCVLDTELHCHEAVIFSQMLPLQFIDSSGLFLPFTECLLLLIFMSPKNCCCDSVFLNNNENIKNLQITGSLKWQAGQMLISEVHLFEAQPLLFILLGELCSNADGEVWYGTFCAIIRFVIVLFTIAETADKLAILVFFLSSVLLLSLFHTVFQQDVQNLEYHTSTAWISHPEPAYNNCLNKK